MEVRVRTKAPHDSRSWNHKFEAAKYTFNYALHNLHLIVNELTLSRNHDSQVGGMALEC